VLGEAILELKALDEEGLLKPIRQRKLVELFRPLDPEKPVIVIDRARLTAHQQHEFDRVVQGPIRGAVAYPRKQHKQTRQEQPSATTSILFVVNNGYSALDHDALRDLVVRRVRNDTSEIDGVVVGGCYFHSDGFDSYLFWPLEYIAVNTLQPFPSYKSLDAAWDRFATRFMTAVVRGELVAEFGKGPVADLQFEHDDVTYVKPAPALGNASSFFVAGRPRRDTVGFDRCPPVATTFPDLSLCEWQAFRASLPNDPLLFDTFERWQAERNRALSTGLEWCPFVPVDVTFEGWRRWSQNEVGWDLSISCYANDLFNARARQLIASAQDWRSAPIKPPRCVLAITEIIGQDKANDVSHVLLVSERINAAPVVQELASNLRIFHEHAVALAAAYAIAQGANWVMWDKDLRYGWT
jgi:hypothetical protein